MAEIKWTAEAEQWLRDIFAYISADKPEAARRVVEGIYQKAQLLQRFPEIGYRYDRYPDLNIRILLYGHYRSPISSSRMEISTSSASFMGLSKSIVTCVSRVVVNLSVIL
ncbi:MAG: type II toxin-antitoxin system RelE/ParE family toxin [Candidatus Margulisiibacteriota bacterium]